MATTTTKSKKKKDIKITTWLLSVHTTQNNTIITLTDENWNAVISYWTWHLWYKGAKKSTPYAAEMLAKQILKQWQWYGLLEIGVVLKWIWMWRDGVFKAINEIWLVDVKYIKEATSLQFWGCKRKRPKRN